MKSPPPPFLSLPRRLSRRHWASTTILASGPALLLLIALTLLGLTPVWVALLAALATLGVSAVLVRPHIRVMSGLAAFLNHLNEFGTPPPGSVLGESALAGELPGALRRLERTLRAHGEALEAASESSDMVLDALPDPLIMIAGDRSVVRVNPAAVSVFGEALFGRDLAVLLRQPALLEAVDRVLAGGEGQTVEVTIPVPVSRTYQAHIEPLPRPTTLGTVAILSLHDVTTLKSSERMQADFIANASHELRTPLSSLIGFIETLRGPAREDQEAQDRFLAIMHDQAARMARLVDGLMSLSRIEMTEHTPPRDRIDLRDIVVEVAETLEMRAAERRMRLELDLPEDLPEVLGDRDDLAQVVQNLVVNAIKYGREETPVIIRLQAGQPMRWAFTVAGRDSRAKAGRGQIAVTLVVQDQGEGISKQHLPRLTERFYRIDKARSRQFGGVGLGLAIVKHIINRHRGILEIESELGQGSTFSIHLPAYESPGTKPPPES